MTTSQLACPFDPVTTGNMTVQCLDHPEVQLTDMCADPLADRCGRESKGTSLSHTTWVARPLPDNTNGDDLPHDSGVGGLLGES